MATAIDYLQQAQAENLLETVKRDGPEQANRQSITLGRIWDQLDPAQQREVVALASRS
jgi:hypothetical protein